jgi:predicted oxidoreductase
MGEKDERTQQIVGAAIEVHVNFGCPRLVYGINRSSLCPLWQEGGVRILVGLASLDPPYDRKRLAAPLASGDNCLQEAVVKNTHEESAL